MAGGAQIFVTGPCAIYVSLPQPPGAPPGPPVFLGHSEDGIETEEERFCEEVRCDIAGARAATAT